VTLAFLFFLEREEKDLTVLSFNTSLLSQKRNYISFFRVGERII
jgi:hypothetical protein